MRAAAQVYPGIGLHRNLHHRGNHGAGASAGQRLVEQFYLDIHSFEPS
jgi:hypothetical protein